MRSCVLVLLLLTWALPCHADCPDAQSAASAAMRERNAKVRETLNTTTPDPEETRGDLSSCLGGISSLGDAFSMGITLPSMDDIMNQMCRQVEGLLQSKLDEALGEARSTISEIGKNNPFKVNGSGADIAGALTQKIK